MAVRYGVTAGVGEWNDSLPGGTVPLEFSGPCPLNPTPKSVITAMAGFEVAFASPVADRLSGSGLGLKLS